MSEDGERLALRGSRGPQGRQGRQGNQGNQGEQGAAGLSGPVRRALVFLFALSVIFGGFNLFWTAHEVHASQAAAQQSGQVLEAKLCTTFSRLAALKPPPGSPRTNPSRAYEQELHATLDELGADLGCKGR